MAKAKASQSYKVTDLSPIAYNGKRAESGEVVNDLPGESIKWLLEGGYIEPVGEPAPSIQTDEDRLEIEALKGAEIKEEDATEDEVK